MLGVYYLHLFAANMFVGWLGGLLERVGAVRFWLLHAGLVALGAVMIFACARLFHRALAPTVDPELAEPT